MGMRNEWMTEEKLMNVLIKVTPKKLSDSDISYINKKMESLTDRISYYFTPEEYDNNIAWFVKRSKKIQVGLVEQKIENGKEFLKTLFEVSEMFSVKYDTMLRYLKEHSEDGK